jgi:hypothetical protein
MSKPGHAGPGHAHAGPRPGYAGPGHAGPGQLSAGQIVINMHGDAWKIIGILEDGRCYIQNGNDSQFIEYDKLLQTSTLVETKLQEIGITDAAAIRQ